MRRVWYAGPAAMLVAGAVIGAVRPASATPGADRCVVAGVVQVACATSGSGVAHSHQQRRFTWWCRPS